MSEGNGVATTSAREQIVAHFANYPNSKAREVAEKLGVSVATVNLAKAAAGLTKKRAKPSKVSKTIVAGLKSGEVAKTTTYTMPSQSVVLDFVSTCGSANAAKAAIDGVAALFAK